MMRNKLCSVKWDLLPIIYRIATLSNVVLRLLTVLTKWGQSICCNIFIMLLLNRYCQILAKLKCHTCNKADHGTTSPNNFVSDHTCSLFYVKCSLKEKRTFFFNFKQDSSVFLKLCGRTHQWITSLFFVGC